MNILLLVPSHFDRGELCAVSGTAAAPAANTAANVVVLKMVATMTVVATSIILVKEDTYRDSEDAASGVGRYVRVVELDVEHSEDTAS